MSVSYIAALQNARMDAVIAAIDANPAPATLEICSASFAAVLCIITLNSDPSFIRSGTPPNVLITMQGVPKNGIAAASGTAVVARIKDGGGQVIVNGLTVGTSGTDVILNSVSITTGQTVTINSGTITHSP